MSKKLVNGELVDLTPDEEAEIIANLPTIEQILADKIKEFTDQIQQFIHDKAWEIGQYGHNGVGNIYNCSVYIGVNSPFESECQALLTWNSACWVKCIEILEAFKSGTIPEPTIEEIIAQLPIYS